ncbi:hypothetical protein ACQKP0_15700 [Heyndrickxia sp. NPDC080065]|uniref:hypothetical protein n=1 Tax=Heyndrickxia sp. NPDC080065 TaxID=3390568 RepID=UPI003CFFB27B
MKPKFIDRLFISNNDNVKTLGERIGTYFMIVCAIFFILTVIIYAISFFFKNDWIVHEMIQLISGVCFTFVFCSAFITLIFMTHNWIWKLTGVLVTLAVFYTATTLMVDVRMIYKDKIAYENKQFEKIVGIPNDVEYDHPESGQKMVYKIMFEDVTVEALNLWIRQDYFEKNMKGKRLEVLYLPNSHYAIDIHVAD